MSNTVPTTMRRPITDSISADEMSRLRDEGLSNKEIAARCGVCSATVYRLIGKQGGFRGGRKPAIAPMRIAVADAPKPIPEQPKRLKSTRLGLAGGVAWYELDLGAKTITAAGKGVEIALELPDVRALIQELIEAEALLT